MRALGYLILKLGGMFMAVCGIANLPVSIGRVLALKEPPPPLQAFAMYLGPSTLNFVIGIGLFLMAGTIVERVIVTPPGDAGPTVDWRPIAQLLAAMLGLYFISDGLGELAYYLGKLALYSQYIAEQRMTWAQITVGDLAGNAAGLVRLCFGTLLFCGADWIPRLFVRIHGTRMGPLLTTPDEPAWRRMISGRIDLKSESFARLNG